MSALNLLKEEKIMGKSNVVRGAVEKKDKNQLKTMSKERRIRFLRAALVKMPGSSHRELSRTVVGNEYGL